MRKIVISTIVILALCFIFLPQQKSLAVCVEGGVGSGANITGTCTAGGRNPDCCPKEGIVPCGTVCCRCQLCDFFVLINRILVFVMFRVAPVIAVLMLVIGGVMFLVSSGNPSTITKAKQIIFSVIIGLGIMYSSYIIVGLLLRGIGLADWVEKPYSSWWTNGIFQIDCGPDFQTQTNSTQVPATAP